MITSGDLMKMVSLQCEFDIVVGTFSGDIKDIVLINFTALL